MSTAPFPGELKYTQGTDYKHVLSLNTDGSPPCIIYGWSTPIWRFNEVISSSYQNGQTGPIQPTCQTLSLPSIPMTTP